MDFSTILGVLLSIGGVVWGAWSWIKAKAPKAQDLVEDLFQRLQTTDILKPVVPPAPPSRMEALQHVEALIQFMEANSNKEGSDALVAILKEILTKKV